MTSEGLILDLFAGPRPGGWSEGLRSLGLSDVGIEWDASACATRGAAGHRTIRADVSAYPTEPFVGRVEGLIASPPCQDFSVAGKGAGIDGLRGQLVREVPRWVEALRPRWVACEQVPPVLPIWQHYAHLFRELGYSTWTGVLSAETFGVPQTRKRAILMASLDRPALPPEPTHQAYVSGQPARAVDGGLFGGGLAPWVSMAEALGWPSDMEQHYQRGAGLIERHGERPFRAGDEPSFTLTGAALGAGGGAKMALRNGSQEHATVRAVDEPAPTILASMDNGDTKWTLQTRCGFDGIELTREGSEPAPSFTVKAGGQWAWARPATTVSGDPRGLPEPKYRKGNERQWNENAIRITVAEASVLQGFDPAYPWSGTRTKQFEQIGNAVPPPMAAAIVGPLVGIATQQRAA